MKHPKGKPDEEITMTHRSRLLTLSAATVLAGALITSLPRDRASADVDEGATLTYSTQATTQLTVNPSDVTSRPAGRLAGSGASRLKMNVSRASLGCKDCTLPINTSNFPSAIRRRSFRASLSSMSVIPAIR